MTRRDDFGRAVRSGRRAGRPTLVAHLSAAPPTTSATGEGAGTAGTTGAPEPARVGLVVSKAVGNAVVRNRVGRRLRHQMSTRVDRLEPGSLLVLRAQPAAADADSSTLGADLDRVLERLLHPVDLPAADLRAADLRAADLRAADLRAADLRARPERTAMRPHPGPEARR